MPPRMLRSGPVPLFVRLCNSSRRAPARSETTNWQWLSVHDGTTSVASMRWWLRSLIALMAVMTLAACSDNSSGTTTTTRTTTLPATTAVATTQPADPASAEITAAFVTFFNGKDADVDKKVALLENGEK